MGLFDNGFRLGTGLAIGIGALILAPLVVPVIASVAKPLVKAGIKGGYMLFAKTQEMLAETREVIEDLAAEAKAELAMEHEVINPVAAAAGEMTGDAS
jgi:hypothetical protein